MFHWTLRVRVAKKLSHGSSKCWVTSSVLACRCASPPRPTPLLASGGSDRQGARRSDRRRRRGQRCRGAFAVYDAVSASGPGIHLAHLPGAPSVKAAPVVGPIVGEVTLLLQVPADHSSATVLSFPGDLVSISALRQRYLVGHVQLDSRARPLVHSADGRENDQPVDPLRHHHHLQRRHWHVTLCGGHNGMSGDPGQGTTTPTRNSIS